MIVHSRSHLEVDEKTGNVTAYVGRDANLLLEAVHLRNAIRFFLRNGQPLTSRYPPEAMRIQAKKFSRKNYYGNGGLEEAEKDLWVWIQEMRDALPVVKRLIL